VQAKRLEGLVASGLVEALGTNRNRTYLLSPRVYEKTSDLLRYVRQKDIDVLRFEELVFSLAEKQGRVTRGDVVELLHIEPSRAYQVLRRLVESDKIELVGKGRYAHYIPTE